MSALLRLEELRETVRLAEARVAAAEAEARRMEGADQRAEQEQARYHERVGAGELPLDPDEEARLSEEIRRMRSEMSESIIQGGGVIRTHAPSQARLAGARRVLDTAIADRDRFVVRKARAIAAELATRAQDLRDRYEPVRVAVDELEREWAELQREWLIVLEPLGLTRQDVPASPVRSTFRRPVTLPVPQALLPDETRQAS